MEREMSRQTVVVWLLLSLSKSKSAITFHITGCLPFNLAHLLCFHFFIAFVRFEAQGNVPNFFLLVVPPEYLCESWKSGAASCTGCHGIQQCCYTHSPDVANAYGELFWRVGGPCLSLWNYWFNFLGALKIKIRGTMQQITWNCEKNVPVWEGS